MNSKPSSSPGLSELDSAKLPSHVAIIMDGNGRWAKRRLMNRIRGHEKGVETVRQIVRTSRRIGISYLTLYAFSTENWQRPGAEVTALMHILKKFLKDERQEMLDNSIRLNALGQIHRLPADVRKTLEETMELTRSQTGMVLNLALSYGGRAEIVEAIREIGKKIRTGEMDPDAVDDETVGQNLYTAGMPDPDLLIRTSGEMRISNFLLWQIAYSEIFITETLWPDFAEEEYVQILKQFQERDRRFGKVAE